MILGWLQQTIGPYAHSLPLEIFSFVAAFLEEIIPPIPAFPVMVMAGSFARIQEYNLTSLFLLAFISASGKTIGAQVVYRVVDKLEDAFVNKFGNLFHLKPGQLEAFGAKLGKGSRDYILLIILRALPVIPSTLISIGSGLILVPQRLFIITTFIGTVLRDSLYLYIGYMGTLAIGKYFHKAGKIQIIITSAVLLTILISLIYYYYKTRKINKSTTNTFDPPLKT